METQVRQACRKDTNQSNQKAEAAATVEAGPSGES